MKKIYIIAGEASGDLHASNLVRAMKKEEDSLCFRGWGGALMQTAGVDLVKHYKDTAFMGFLTVLLNLRKIFANIRYCKEDVLAYRPDAIVLVDYAGFNLRIAQFAKEHNIPVFYYIAPKVWAWKEDRVKKMQAYIDKLYCILPFEKEYFTKKGIDTFYAGNPLLDAIENRTYKEETIEEFRACFGLDDRPIIALLPGSRKQEIKHLLPTMLQMVKEFPQYQFVLALAPGLSVEYYGQFTNGYDIYSVSNATYRLLEHSCGALVASGTATLETALLNVPQVVCYNTVGGRLAYAFGKWLIKTEFISLVNLILGKQAVEELIITYFTPENLKKSLSRILKGEKREQILEDYKSLHLKMGKAGVSESCAKELIKDLNRLN